MKRERLLEELRACQKRLEEMTEVVERRIEVINGWDSYNTAKPAFASDVVEARRTLEDAERIIAKLD